MIMLKHTATKVFREQVQLLFANSMVPVIVSVLCAALLCCALWTVVDHSVLVGWMAVFFSISVFRIRLLLLFTKQEARVVNEDYWYRRFLIGTYAIGAVWGAASFFLFPTYSLSHQVMLIVILVGMAGGGVFSLCPILPVITGFVSLLLLPLTIKMLTLGTGEGMFKGVLVFLFWAVTLIGAMKISKNLRENIQLRLQSIDREKILKVSEQRYRHIFTNAPLGIIHYDAESVIIDCNEELLRILGSSRELLVGVKMIDVLQEQRMIKALNDSLTIGEGYYEGNYTSVTGDATTPIRAFLKAISSLDQTIIGGVGIVEDFYGRIGAIIGQQFIDVR